jgi:hypothetical protein
MKPLVFGGFLFTLGLPMICCGQVNTGSNGSDGAFNPTNDVVIDMSDHPTGVYQYTSVNVPSGVAVTFVPNMSNTPVVWLVQSNCVIGGSVDVGGKDHNGIQGGLGGPGGYAGGNGPNGNSSATGGQGPGGGPVGQGGQYAYGNAFLLPLLGGSGGGGGCFNNCGGLPGCTGGGGGGGAILIAASGSITITGSLRADGGPVNYCGTAGGSGGAVRFVASRLSGNGQLTASGGSGANGGRIRFDTYNNQFTGFVAGQFSSGVQLVILPTNGPLPGLTVVNVGGVPVSASPTGMLATPDAVLSAQQTNPVPIVVHCSNVPLGTAITVSVKPANGAPVTGVSYNSGTASSSTATVSIVMPRGGGLIYATAATLN